MHEIILCKLGEVVLKGLNRRSFEMKLMSNIRRRTQRFGKFKIYSRQSTIYVEPAEDTCDIAGAYAACKQVFGIIAITRALPCEKSKEAIFDTAKTYLADALTAAGSFKVEIKRADKTIPMGSIQLSQWVGGALHDAFPHLTVDVHHPELTVYEEVREDEAYVHGPAEAAAGGLPLQMSITEDIEVIRHYVDIADGIAIPGGPDVNPKRWGDERPYDPTLCCEIRDRFEFKLVNEVLRAKKPLFTTCRGTQLLNVATGGTLCMDVPSLGAREGRTQWRHTHVLNDPVHPVEVVPGSLLERAVGGHRLIQTNSAHHCCVDRLGKSTRLVAKATDGVPECIEVEGQPFCLGVQWHPEYTWKTLETDFNLWKSFVEAAAKVKQAR